MSAQALSNGGASRSFPDCSRSLLLPLENVKGRLKYHPEGDALYHSLQVFDLARDEWRTTKSF